MQRIGVDRRGVLPQLAPGHRAIAIGIQPDGVIQVAQRDRPLHRQLAAVHIDMQIGTAGAVGQCPAGQQQSAPDQARHQKGHPTAHDQPFAGAA
jgi:hypothetical protein